jgi:hypothetical protein
MDVVGMASFGLPSSSANPSVTSRRRGGSTASTVSGTAQCLRRLDGGPARRGR